MTYFNRRTLEKTAEGIDDADQRALLKDVIAGHRFSSTGPDGVTLEGEFHRALEKSRGLTELSNSFAPKYRNAILDLEGKL